MATVKRRKPAVATAPSHARSKPPTPRPPTLYPVRCRFCDRLLGQSTSDRAKGILCNDPLCRAFPPVTEHEDRDAGIVLMAQSGVIPAEISKRFGITRQRVVQVLAAARGEPRATAA